MSKNLSGVPLILDINTYSIKCIIKTAGKTMRIIKHHHFYYSVNIYKNVKIWNNVNKSTNYIKISICNKLKEHYHQNN
jgi:hypothetical protein